jgi:hypothetical protein
MRTELYKAIGDRLLNLTGLDDESVRAISDDKGKPIIKHVDLWNRNVEFIEEDDPFPMPAVFVEFGEILWTPFKTGSGEGYRGNCEVRLHIVTRYQGSSAHGSKHMKDALDDIELSPRIQRALTGLRGETYDNFRIVATHTNHDHEEIVEAIDIYSVHCERFFYK